MLNNCIVSKIAHFPIGVKTSEQAKGHLRAKDGFGSKRGTVPLREGQLGARAKSENENSLVLVPLVLPNYCHCSWETLRSLCPCSIMY